mmetsp:Transcript_101575/g.185360  ORF Transcript_101575/g.185360 Transcript_101575/m.185360 type:complete len:111 (-) Transcript_101575:1954-2286(-)
MRCIRIVNTMDYILKTRIFKRLLYQRSGSTGGISVQKSYAHTIGARRSMCNENGAPDLTALQPDYGLSTLSRSVDDTLEPPDTPLANVFNCSKFNICLWICTRVLLTNCA